MESRLLMTPQLQLAVSLLSRTPGQVRALLEAEAARLGVLRRCLDDEVDPLDAGEEAEAAEDGRPPWLAPRVPPLAPRANEPEPDVWVVGTVATANLVALRYVVTDGPAETTREALWLVKAVRQRGKTFERVAAALVTANASYFEGLVPTPTRVRFSDLAKSTALHQSTVERICAVGVMQSDTRGVLRYDALIESGRGGKQ